MDVNTHLEDLSNEIFFEIFDYLHIFDIFTGFTLLNRRISSILQSIPLHIVISKKHCRRQIDFLSSHLTFHEHQVISINISDTIRDDSSIISLLFNRHNFSHLKSCKLMSIDSMTTLGNVIEQIQSLNTLVLLQIFQPNYENITKNDNDQLTQTILTHKSSSLRSIELQYPHHYLDVSNYTSLGSNVTSLNLWIAGSPSTVSIYSVLRVFRVCHRIRYLCIILQHDKRFENNNVNVPSDEPLTNENDLPILSQLTSFELNLDAIFDIWSISYILRFNFRRTIDDNKNASQNLTYLSCFVHLWNVKKLEFRSSFHADRWKDVQLILQACPNVDSLIINTPLLVLSKLIDNSFLIPIFKQIKMIKSITEDIYFPSAFASKFVQRFPSLCHIELQVFSFDNCSFIIDIFLTELKQISYLKINYDDTYFDDPFSCEYIITKRRQAFSLDIINEQMVNVKNNGEVIEIWLS
ncbi:unnamed protein product [Rotaria sordida]|uniref:F-box domain-containing protein n=1 Tax=Rotaria sordida TaxID=392033 RepID=A0A816ELB0_9BILA|nr:unnamed protein product [Rotaria sordida]CAF1648134.1 unnamed protein product [Rotaria sordida]